MNERNEPELLHWTPEMVERFWDYTSRSADQYFTEKHGAEIVRHLVPQVPAGARVLDYGCGPGFLLGDLLKQGFQVAGLDSSEESRRVVEEKYAGQGGFIGAFAPGELDSAEPRFDAVLVIEVIEHLYDEQLDGLLESLRGLLNPGGVVLFTTPNEEDLAASYVLCPETNKLFHRWQHVRRWSAASLTEYLQQRGFEVPQILATNFAVRYSAWHEGRWVRRNFRTLRRRAKQRLRGPGQQPHLLAVARVPASA